MIYKELDYTINTALDVFKTHLSNVSFPAHEAVHFTLNKELVSLELPKEFEKQGVYFFELKLPYSSGYGVKTETIVNNIIKGWKHKSTKGIWSPGVKQSRLNAHLREGTKKYNFAGEWIPFYIGKSRNICKRVNSHIFQDAGKTSFGMKLKARTVLYGLEFRVSCIPIDVEHYDMIVPYVERHLREKLNPIVGKQ